jgi:light-regulated signal transduction histidine kinase (bacteriophytochrome)
MNNLKPISAFAYNKKIKVSVLESEIQSITEGILSHPFPDGFADFFIYILSELCANIIEHSQAKTCVIDIFIDKREMKLSVEDNGIGFRNSYLSNKKHVRDDRSAIMLALNGLSTKKLNERAFGLSSVRLLTEHQKGKMTIESGKCKVDITNNKMDFEDAKKSRKGVNINVQTKVSVINIYNIIK